jgi:hypothetical protein
VIGRWSDRTAGSDPSVFIGTPATALVLQSEILFAPEGELARLPKNAGVDVARWKQLNRWCLGGQEFHAGIKSA